MLCKFNITLLKKQEWNGNNTLFLISKKECKWEFYQETLQRNFGSLLNIILWVRFMVHQWRPRILAGFRLGSHYACL
jgi:hypothetical protein